MPTRRDPWTRERPTKSGYYWFRAPRSKYRPTNLTIVEIERRPDGTGIIRQLGSDCLDYLLIDPQLQREPYASGEWHGPLPTPDEIADEEFDRACEWAERSE